MKKAVIILCAMFLTTIAVHAQKPEVVTNNKAGWHKIGEVKVDFKSDKDEFLVLGADRFKSLRVKITDAPVHMEDMQIAYEGGATEDVALRSDFKAGSQSRVIDLKNNSAELKKVSFVYHTISNSKTGKAHLELWGLK